MHHAGIGPVIMNAEFFQFQVLIPGKHHKTAMKNGVNVMPEAGIVAVFVGIEPAADFHVFLNDHDLLAALAEISRADHTVVPGAYHNAVVF